MCALCGNLGGPAHWTEDPGDARLRERLVGRILHGRGLALRTWNGNGGGYIVARPDGPSELAPSLSAVWAIAERASGEPSDPLDPALIRSLEGEDP